MYRVTVTYAQPTDASAFDEHYSSVHTPLVTALPGLKRFTTSRGEALLGGDAPWFMQAQLYFDSREDAVAALSSEVGQAGAADMAHFATGGATLAGSEEIILHP